MDKDDYDGREEDYERYYSDPVSGIDPGAVILGLAALAFFIMATILILRG